MNTYILFLLGFISGVILAHILIFLKRTFGTLEIDLSNPEKETYRIYIDFLDKVKNKKSVILKIRTKTDKSQDEQSLLWEYYIWKEIK